MDPVLDKEIQNLIDGNLGDNQRLEFIRKSLQDEKKIYNSDQKYLMELLKEHSKDEDILERLEYLNPKKKKTVTTFADNNNNSKSVSNKSEKPTTAWYLAPILVGLVGSFFMWLILKNNDHLDTPKMIRKGWIIGIVIAIIAFILGYLPSLIISGMYLFS